MPQKPEINIIVAVADNMAIGRGGDMPWHLSADMRFFKEKTLGNSVIMGRRTWESLGCKPLPQRQNIIISSKILPAANGEYILANSLQEAIQIAAGPQIFVIGGGVLYREAISLVNRIYLTQIHTVVEDADTYFPAIDSSLWVETARSKTETDAKSSLQFEFLTYERK